MSLSEPAIPAPPGEVSDLENPEDVIHTVNFATQVICLVVVTIVVALRFLVKARLRKPLELEDWTTILGWVLFVGFCANMIILGNYGGGYHAWDVSESDMINFQKASYAVTLVYVPMVFVIKVALLAVVLRIFAVDRQKVMLVYGTIVVLLLYYIPALFIKIFFCKPISAYWYGVEATNGTCLDQRKVIIADATISMISDFWILVLPIPMLWSLKMTLNKKLRVIGILGAGGLATGFSIWRLVMMVEESRTPDTTWFWIHCVLTGNAEAGIGLICACLPTLSSYIVTRKLKSQSGSGSYRRNYELNSYNKLSSANKKGSLDPTATMASFGGARTDEAYLFSTVEAEGGREPSLGGSSQERERAGIQKDVIVQQSFEYVK
ncbi:hypothetical protein BJX68DRAFT_247884 [Aspergillus pseudodeflectus]|uniref:Rhodopsin domain-containing protein n=1 Tax=Aspergillus pseudodeflectus TaxID=176178 RepID=A0ABR4JJL8_9EURO